MKINEIKQHIEKALEVDSKLKTETVLATKKIKQPESGIDWALIEVVAVSTDDSDSGISKIQVRGSMLHKGKIADFSRSYRPAMVEASIKRTLEIDYHELYSDINELSAMIQKDLLSSQITTFSPLFEDQAFKSWWNNHFDIEVITAIETTSVPENHEDTTILIVSANLASTIYDFMVTAMTSYYKAIIEQQKKVA